jgi:hypothetical protein
MTMVMIMMMKGLLVTYRYIFFLSLLFFFFSRLSISCMNSRTLAYITHSSIARIGYHFWTIKKSPASPFALSLSLHHVHKCISTARPHMYICLLNHQSSSVRCSSPVPPIQNTLQSSIPLRCHP